MNAEERRRKALDDYLAAKALRMAEELGPDGCASLTRAVKRMNDEHDQEVADAAIEFLERKYCGPAE